MNLSKNLLQNKSGTVAPVAFLLTFLILAFLVVNISKMLTGLAELKFRNKSYLCAQLTIYEVKSYYKYQSALNRLVQTGYWLQFSPEPNSNSAGRIMHKTSKALQDLYHISYLKNLATSSTCSWKNTALLSINTPVELESKIKLKRDFDGSVIFKDKWKTYLIFIAPKNLEKLRYSFSIELDFLLMKGFAFHNFKLSSKEINSKDLWKLKQLVGQSLF